MKRKGCPRSPMKPMEGKRKVSGSWQSVANDELLIYTTDDCVSSTKIVGFSLHNVLVKSARAIPISSGDWAFACHLKKLKDLCDDGCKIVIFENQKYNQNKNTRPIDLQRTLEIQKEQIENIAAQIGVPIQVFLAIGGGKYRKPCSRMWDEMASRNGPFNSSECFYVGNTPGKSDQKGFPTTSPSRIDRYFALNCGIDFKTSKQFFSSNAKVPTDDRILAFDAKEFLEKEEKNLFTPIGTVLPWPQQEVIVMVGYPGSGKSVFCEKLMKEYGYEIVSRSTQGTSQRCVDSMELLLSNGKSVVIDHMHPDIGARSHYVRKAKRLGVNCRCFEMKSSLEQALHHCRYRTLTSPGWTDIYQLTFQYYEGMYEQPTVHEGFDEVVTVNFIPKFENDANRRIYEQFLTDY